MRGAAEQPFRPAPGCLRQRGAAPGGYVAALLALLLSLTPAAGAGPGSGSLVRLWDVEHGLPQSSVTDIAQTFDGYLWVGTLHSGLARFDGLRFECFDLANTPQLGHPGGVRRLLVDSQGRLWINTYALDLLVWQAGTFTSIVPQGPQVEALIASQTNEVVFCTAGNHLFRLHRGPQGPWQWDTLHNSGTNPVSYYVGGADGTIWYRRRDGRIGRVQQNSLVDLESIPGWPYPRRHNLQGDPAGGVWIFRGDRLGRWDGVAFCDMTPTNAEPLSGVVRITPGPKGSVWVETANQMRRCQNRQWIAEAKEWDPHAYGAPRGGTRRMDASGGLWIHVSELGLVHLWPDGRLEQISRDQGLLSTALTPLFIDQEGDFWAGYTRGGLISIRPRLFHTLGQTEGLGDSLVASVCADRSGAVWIGSAGGKVSRWQDGKLTSFTLPQLGAHCLAPLVAPAKDGRLWVATDGNGLLVYENSQFRHQLPPEHFPAAPRALLVDRANRLWVATFSGLYRLDGERWALVQPIRGTGDYPGALCEAADGSVWLGTLGGELWRFGATDTNYSRYKLPATGLQKVVSALLADPDGSLWVGTQGGRLWRWTNGVASDFNCAEALPEARIWQLLDDGRGGLWVGTGAGIARLDKAQLRAGGQLQARRFGPSDGLQSASGTPEFKPNCWRSDDGRLWFATAKGVVYVDPATMGEEHAAPPALIQSVAVGDRVQPVGPTGPLSREPLTAGPGSQSLEFRYTALDFRHPELIRFRHRLEGLDADWIVAGQNRLATYRHVPPGNYVFQVSACNASGEWNPAAAELPIRVVPHLWQTGWFRALCLATLALGLVGTVRYVSFRRLQARLARLEQEAALQQERARIAKDIHDDIGASLTEIAFLSELAQKRLHNPPQARGHIDQIFQKARAVTRAIDDIVWSFNPRNDTVEGLVLHLGKFAPEFLNSAGIRCRLDVPFELPALPLDSRVRHHLYLAIKEALHNVVKHSGATEVWLRVQPADHALTISIEDNGRGFAAAQPAPAEADGLANMRQRLTEAGGHFAQTSRQGAGTVTRFTVPLAKEQP